mgnify:CR=1 FL=1
MSVFASGEFLVFGGFRRDVQAIVHNQGEFDGYEIRFVETDSPVATGSGRLSGLIASRDEVVTGFLTQLNDFAETLIIEFNKIYSSGQGFSGFDSVTSTFQVESEFAALDASGLEFAPVNGSFQVLMHDKLSDLTRTTDIRVQSNGLDDDTTLVSLSAALDAIVGISSSISVDGGLTLTTDSANLEFAFAGDTSGTLTALGINTFFTGSTAFDIAVNNDVATDLSKFAASRGGCATTGNRHPADPVGRRTDRVTGSPV